VAFDGFAAYRVEVALAQAPLSRMVAGPSVFPRPLLLGECFSHDTFKFGQITGIVVE
jgi:hypothetical protein